MLKKAGSGYTDAGGRRGRKSSGDVVIAMSSDSVKG